MMLGILMKGFNDAYKKDLISFCSEFIPQVILLLSLFGFMDLMIIQKWTTDWTGKENEAPSIISQVINNMLKGGEVIGAPLVGDKAY